MFYTRILSFQSCLNPKFPTGQCISTSFNINLSPLSPNHACQFFWSARVQPSDRLPVAATDLTGNPADWLLSVCIWIPHSSITAQSELRLWGVQKRCSESLHGNLEQRKSNYVKKQSTATNLPDKLFFADCGNRFAELNQLQLTIIWLLFWTWIAVLYHGYSYELEGQLSSTSVCGNQSAGEATGCRLRQLICLTKSVATAILRTMMSSNFTKSNF